MIVVDTNTIIYLYVQGDRTPQAEAALFRDPDWIAPILWRSEFRNVLASMIQRRRLTLEQALGKVEAAERQLVGGEFEVVSSQVLDLASASGCTAYDCEFVALARELDVSLVTADRQLIRAFPDTVVPLEDFAA